MKLYTVKVDWMDRRWGKQYEQTRVTATSIGTAVARGIKQVLKGLESKQRRDASKAVWVEAVYVGRELQDASPEVKAMADALIDGRAS